MSLAVLTRRNDPVGAFGVFLTEILRTEGLVDYEQLVVDGSTTEAFTGLHRYDAVVLTRMRLTRVQVDAVVSYVEGGGRLVVVRPSIPLAQALGLTPAPGMTDRAYVRPVGDHPVSGGVPHEPIQTHVCADDYLLDDGGSSGGASTPAVAAELYGAAATPSAFPAVLCLDRGAGRAVVFTYDLAHAVARIRHGDPDRVGGRALGNGTQSRVADLLIGYADPACWHLPQADIHAMLLGNAVNHLARSPQPRWWYFPSPDIRSVLVLDSDDDWSTREQFDALLEAVERHGGHITIYLMMSPSRRTVATPELVARWRERGHSFGVHHDPYDPVYDGADEEEVLDRAVRREIASFEQDYGTTPVTNRNHCVAHRGYVDVAALYAQLGVVMDLNAVSNGPAWLDYLNGSGRPCRFVDADGSVVDAFQQGTQAFDDRSVQDVLTADPAGEAAATRRRMVERVTTYFSPLSMLSHPVSFATYSREYQERCWAAAGELGMPIWSAVEWAEFVRARDAARIRRARWSGAQFSATVEGSSPCGSLTLMLPIPADRVATARVNGEAVQAHPRHAFGWDYTLLEIALPSGADGVREVAVSTTTGD